MSAPTTAEVREMLEGESLSVLDEVLSVAEHRDALAADVARLRADIEMFQRSASQAEQTRRDLAAEVARLREALAASEARAEKLLSRVVATAECGCARRQAALERVEPAPSLCSKSDRCSFCRAAALVRELGEARGAGR